MSKKYIPVLLSILLSLYACSDKQEQKENIDNPINTATLNLDTFTTFPPEVDGCACYFASDSVGFKKKNYLYVDNYDKVSFLKINGILTKFTETSSKKTGNKTFITTKSADYEMTLEMIHGARNGDETWLQTGTIQLKDKKGNTISKSFYGECGC